MAWTIFTQISSDESGWHHVYANVKGTDVDEAKAGADYLLNALAEAKLAVIRVRPEASEEQDFDTKEYSYKGHVRFSYRDEPGEWKYSIPDSELPNMIGLGSDRADG